MGMMQDTAGFVTAAGSGIGRASALAFAAEGARVVVSDVDEAGGRETVELISKAGGEACFVAADVADEAQVEALVEAAVQQYGTLDWAHSNAGILAPQAKIADQQKEWWDKVVGVNLIGTVWCLKHSIRQMLAQGNGGAIVLTASTSALIAGAGTSSYAATKWGILGLMKTAAMEYATENIRVNALCPAITRSDKTEANWDKRAKRNQAILDLIPMGRMAELHEQADAAVWLCSSRASFVTGVALPVDGGQTMGGVQAWD